MPQVLVNNFFPSLLSQDNLLNTTDCYHADSYTLAECLILLFHIMIVSNTTETVSSAVVSHFKLPFSIHFKFPIDCVPSKSHHRQIFAARFFIY